MLTLVTVRVAFTWLPENVKELLEKYPPERMIMLWVQRVEWHQGR
jgi:hypothetical protein